MNRAMKTLASIMFVLLLPPCMGQAIINQKTDNGQKTGTWIEFHENGLIDRVLYYEPAEREYTVEEAFFYGIDSENDSLKYFEILKWIEIYEYRENWEIKRIKKTENSQKPRYFYGPDKEISLEISNQFIIDRATTVVNINIELTNNTDKLLTLTPVLSTQNLNTEHDLFELPPNQKSVLEFEVLIESMDNNYVITLINDSILIEYDIMTRGFHINSADFEFEGEMTLPTNFVFHRTGNEALLKILDSEKNKAIRTIPLSKEWNQIDLSNLTAGYYWINTVNYTDEKLAYIKVWIE